MMGGRQRPFPIPSPVPALAYPAFPSGPGACHLASPSSPPCMLSPNLAPPPPLPPAIPLPVADQGSGVAAGGSKPHPFDTED